MDEVSDYPVTVIQLLWALSAMMIMDLIVVHVRIFDWNGTNWQQRGLDIDGENTDNESGAERQFV